MLNFCQVFKVQKGENWSQGDVDFVSEFVEISMEKNWGFSFSGPEVF